VIVVEVTVVVEFEVFTVVVDWMTVARIITFPDLTAHALKRKNALQFPWFFVLLVWGWPCEENSTKECSSMW